MTSLEDARQAMFGFRRDEAGEAVDPLFYAADPQVKQAMEQARLRMMGYCRNQQGEICTLEEVVQQLQGREAAVEIGTQHQARVNLGGLDGASVSASWRYSSGVWTVSCKACGLPVYQERGSYPQEKLRGEDDAATAIREHRLVCGDV